MQCVQCSPCDHDYNNVGGEGAAKRSRADGKLDRRGQRDDDDQWRRQFLLRDWYENDCLIHILCVSTSPRGLLCMVVDALAGPG